MKITRKAEVVWKGEIKDGKGTVSTQSGALSNYPYGLGSRFEGKVGTNPEELLAAAHASCFTMALALLLTDAKLAPEELATTAEVTLAKIGLGFEITGVALTVKGRVQAATAPRFIELAQLAKSSCPLSKTIKAPITLKAEWLPARAIEGVEQVPKAISQ